MKLGNIIDRHIIESIQILFAKIFIIRAMRSSFSTYILTSVWLVQYSRSRYKIIINTSICMILSPILRFYQYYVQSEFTLSGNLKQGHPLDFYKKYNKI